jgi:hypothetical protein
MTKLVCAAISINGVIFAGVRHYDMAMHSQIGLIADFQKWKSLYTEKQGFLDDKGNFHTRAEARQIAIDAGQILDTSKLGTTLFSENLW